MPTTPAIPISAAHQSSDEQGLNFSMLQERVVHCGSLPCPPLTSFVGRRREMIEIKKLLDATRLLTLTGTGGCGKTRLALQLVMELTKVFKQEVCWIELATLADSALIVQAVVSALHVREQPHCSLLDTLADALRHKSLLLVLDNCEHVVSACARLAETLLSACPNLRILATSQEALRIGGEIAWRVPPLHLPEIDHLPSLETLIQYEAVELFIERTTTVLPSFRLTQENAPAVVQVCQRLDGIPLAIELAATRTKMLSVEQIATRLDDSCHLLTIGSRTALPRQQTLRATIDWSYGLLSEQERTLFRRLAVFAGSFTLEAAEKVCVDEQIKKDEILDLLSHLVDKSLVLVEERHSEVRYRVLETLRQYGQDQLQSWKETTVLYQRYSNYEQASTNVAVKRTTQSDEGTCPSVIKGAVQSELCLFALGPARVYRGKQALAPTDWTYAKARELLFYLLNHDARTKEQIGLALWPDASSTQLRNSFHATLHHLRRALGRSEWILFEHDRYSFNRQLPYWFDVEAFDSHMVQARQLQTQAPTQAIYHLEKATKLYQGNFLEDLFAGDWYQRRQAILQTMYTNALLTLGQLFFAGKQYVQAAETYRQLITHDNYVEVAHRELMRCYAYQGERGQALRHYQSLTAFMRDELGALPAPETTALFEGLRKGDSEQ